MSDMFRLDGKVALIAGAGAGIGAAVTRGLADQGATIVSADIDAVGAERTAAAAREAGGRAESLELDILDRQAVASAFNRVREAHGTVDVAVCTPGVNVRKPLLDYTDEEFERVIALNLRGTLNLFRAAGRVMAEQGSGSIIAFSSIRSQVVEPGQGIYAATKAGIVQMVRTLAAELGPQGVRVNAIAPGVVDTPLTAPIKATPDWYAAYADRTVFKRWASAEEMAGPAAFLASDAASYVTGTVLFVDGGWTAIDGRFDPAL